MYIKNRPIQLILFMLSIGTIMLFAVLVGCTPQSSLQAPTISLSGQWLKTFLNNPTCQPPCWENITPGKTPIGNIPDLLNSIDDVVNIQGPRKYPRNEQVDFAWNFSDDHSEGWILSDIRGEFVIQISLMPQALSLNYVTEKYGDPDQMFIAQTEYLPRPDLYIIYSRLNMVLETSAYSKNGIFNLGKGQGISRINLSQDGWIEQLIAKLTPPSKLVNWHGYGDYTIPWP